MADYKIVVNPPPVYKIIHQSPGPARTLVLNVGPPGPAGADGISPGVKAGIVSGGSFSGSPKKYSVVFSSAYPDTNYQIQICGTDARAYTYESKTASGFTINANAATAISGEVSWATSLLGES